MQILFWDIETKAEKLEKEIDTLRHDNEFLHKQYEKVVADNKDLTKRLNGERICDFYCDACEHYYGTNETVMDIHGRTYTRNIRGGCLLDCKCDDFKRMETNNDNSNNDE